jgi:hypothetical protein
MVVHQSASSDLLNRFVRCSTLHLADHLCIFQSKECLKEKLHKRIKHIFMSSALSVSLAVCEVIKMYGVNAPELLNYGHINWCVLPFAVSDMRSLVLSNLIFSTSQQSEKTL